MVTIKDYTMPTNCWTCDLHNYHECNLTAESIEEDYCWNGDSREKHCPLREVKAIPKDQYETRLKADMLSMLTEIQLETESLRFGQPLRKYVVDECLDIIQQKIDKLKEVNNEEEKTIL